MPFVCCHRLQVATPRMFRVSNTCLWHRERIESKIQYRERAPLTIEKNVPNLVCPMQNTKNAFRFPKDSVNAPSLPCRKVSFASFHMLNLPSRRSGYRYRQDLHPKMMRVSEGPSLLPFGGMVGLWRRFRIPRKNKEYRWFFAVARTWSFGNCCYR